MLRRGGRHQRRCRRRGGLRRFSLGFDLPSPTDEVFLIDEVRVIIDKKHLLYVLGAEVGYEPGGFTVSVKSDE